MTMRLTLKIWREGRKRKHVYVSVYIHIHPDLTAVEWTRGERCSKGGEKPHCPPLGTRPSVLLCARLSHVGCLQEEMPSPSTSPPASTWLQANRSFGRRRAPGWDPFPRPRAGEGWGGGRRPGRAPPPRPRPMRSGESLRAANQRGAGCSFCGAARALRFGEPALAGAGGAARPRLAAAARPGMRARRPR